MIRTDDCAFGAMMLSLSRLKFKKRRFRMIDDTQPLLLTKPCQSGKEQILE
jgi:hypothetical protein